jgi:hypothetical protein
MLQVKAKGKTFLPQVMKTQMGDGMLSFQPFFDIQHN